MTMLLRYIKSIQMVINLNRNSEQILLNVLHGLPDSFYAKFHNVFYVSRNMCVKILMGVLSYLYQDSD